MNKRPVVIKEMERVGKAIQWDMAKILCPEDFPGPNPYDKPPPGGEVGSRTWTSEPMDMSTKLPDKGLKMGMIKTTHLTIPGTFPGLNEILEASKGHWSKYRKMKAAHTDKVALLARACRLKPIQHPATIYFRWIEPNKKRDKDNVAAGGRKCVLDGLMQAGVLPTDGWRWLAGFTDEFAVDKQNPRVEITIREEE